MRTATVPPTPRRIAEVEAQSRLPETLVYRKRLAMLERAADHLAARIAAAGEATARLHYDRANLDALRWAVRTLTSEKVQALLRSAMGGGGGNGRGNR